MKTNRHSLLSLKDKINVNELESIGKKCARRNGTVEDPLQKESILNAVKICRTLINSGYYNEALNVVSCVCNMTMGPFKAECAQRIAAEFIKHSRYKHARKIAVLLAPLKGQLKIKTALHIARRLHRHSQYQLIKDIYSILKKNSAKYAQKAAAKCKLLIKPNIKQPVKFIDTFKFKNASLLNSNSKKHHQVDTGALLKLMAVIKKILNTQSNFQAIQCITHDTVTPKIELNFNSTHLKLFVQSAAEKIVFMWEFQSNNFIKNNSVMTHSNQLEFSGYLNNLVAHIQNRGVQINACSRQKVS